MMLSAEHGQRGSFLHRRGLFTLRGDSRSLHLISTLCRDPHRTWPLWNGHRLFLARPQAASQGRLFSEQGFPLVNYGVQQPAVHPSR